MYSRPHTLPEPRCHGLPSLRVLISSLSAGISQEDSGRSLMIFLHRAVTVSSSCSPVLCRASSSLAETVSAVQPQSAHFGRKLHQQPHKQLHLPSQASPCISTLGAWRGFQTTGRLSTGSSNHAGLI